MKNEIIVVETVTAVAGKETELRDELKKLVSPSLAEPDCLHYEIGQAKDNPGIFLVLMKWAIPEALEQHENSAHIAEFVRKFDGVLYSDFSINVWNKM